MQCPVVDEPCHIARQISRRVVGGIKRSITGDATAFDEIELHEGDAECHILKHLIHGDLVVVDVLGIRDDADVERGHGCQERVARLEAREGDVILKTVFGAELFKVGQFRAGADDQGLDVLATEFVDDEIHGLDHQVDTVLRAHDPDEADEMAAALAAPCAEWPRGEAPAELHGLLANPMVQCEPSRFALHAVAAWARPS